MSIVEDDTELRDLLVQTLEKNGTMAKLRVSTYYIGWLTYYTYKGEINSPLEVLKFFTYTAIPRSWVEKRV